MQPLSVAPSRCSVNRQAPIDLISSPRPLVSFFSGLASVFGGGKKAQKAEPALPMRPPGAPRGIYMHGGVGTGKTFIMDLFFDSVPVREKRRVHFNAFMLDVHARLHKLRDRPGGVEPIVVVTR